MVIDVLPIPTDTSFLNTLPAISISGDTPFAAHPYIQFAESQLEVSKSKEQLLKKSYLPKLTVFGIAFSRGSGIQPDGSIKTFNGLGFSRFNYGTGVQLAFPITKYGEVKRQLQVQNLLTESAKEIVLESNSQLLTQQHIAYTTFSSSLSVAAETGRQLQSAQYAFNAMQARYSTGLVSLSDVVQVQYNLLQAELDVKAAYWNSWKALLLQAAIKGDLNLFLNEIK
jgi:outer membrane protein TolC